jgi:hypothetical protein
LLYEDDLVAEIKKLSKFYFFLLGRFTTLKMICTCGSVLVSKCDSHEVDEVKIVEKVEGEGGHDILSLGNGDRNEMNNFQHFMK